MKRKGFPYENFDGIDCEGNDKFPENNFIKTFLINKKSLFSGVELSSSSPADLLIAYCEKYNELSNKNGEIDKKQVKFNDLLEGVKTTLNKAYNKEFLNHAIWLWAYPNNKKSEPIALSDDKEKNKEYASLFKSIGVAGAGSGYVQYKTRGVLYCLYLITKAWTACECYNCTDSTSIKLSLRTFLLEDEYKISNGRTYVYKTPESVRNLLLHLISPDDFEAIAAQKDKEQIVKAFEFLIDEKNPGKTNLPSVDNSLKIIREALQKEGQLEEKDTFYSKEEIRLMWRGYSSTDLSLCQMLEIKKAVILFGPPGTGKTYTARNLAKQLAIRDDVEILKTKRKDKTEKKIEGITEQTSANSPKIKKDAWDEIKAILSSTKTNGKEKIDEYISNLQFHINYTYEDFMVGQTIQGNNVVVTPGFIFDVINKAQKDNKPHIVILDEINRTDISRVFGELFSAMEYRDRRYDLPYRVDPNAIPYGYEKFFDKKGHMFLTLPKNIYFIGTMNEIDFSLERVDFALRRRFLWEYAGYKEEALEEMLQEHDYMSKVDFSGFVDSCTALNEKIENNKELGKKYSIGQAFFDISEELWKAANQKINNAKKILWEISIKPTIEAYCGSMDENSMDTIMKSCEEAFMNNSNDYV